MKISYLIILIAYARLSVATRFNYTECKQAIASYSLEDCPLWQYKSHSGKCVWARHTSIENFLKPPEFDRDAGRSLLSKGYCVTFDHTFKTNLTYLGRCPYNTKFSTNPLLHLPVNVSRINKYMCGSLKRKGLLCSQCKSELGVAVFSYFRECKKCLNPALGWFLFFVRLVAPMTLLLVIGFVFQSHVAASSLNGFVLMAQLIVTTFNLNPYVVDGLEHSVYSSLKFIADIYGIFNLDFFTYLIPSFCISEGMSILVVLALEYLIALYPIVFTIIIYCLISLHDRGCKPITFCCRPLQTRLARFRRQWNVRGSVINTFATFVLLSYSKFCVVTWNLLGTVDVWDICGNHTTRTYFDANIYSISTPYLVIIVIVSLCVILVPALFLLFYQFRLVHKCLSSCKIKCTLLHELANIAQGCFKNGTEPGTRDYRWFAGAYLLVRVVLIFIVNLKYADLVHIFIPCAMAALLLWLRPYKVNWINALDAVFWSVLAVSNIWFLYYEAFDNVYRIGPYIFKSIPLLYLVCYTVYIQFFRVKMYCTARKNRNVVVMCEQNNGNEELPDRLIHPDEYSSLLEGRVTQ